MKFNIRIPRWPKLTSVPSLMAILCLTIAASNLTRLVAFDKPAVASDGHRRPAIDRLAR